MRRLIVLLAVFALLMIAAAPAGATPGEHGMAVYVNCGDGFVEVGGVSVPGFPEGTAPPILLFGGDFTIYNEEGGDVLESFTEDPPPGLVRTNKLTECEISLDLPSGEYVTIDPAWMMIPKP